MLLRPLPADHPGLIDALRRALDGGPPLAPLPPDPADTLDMLRPEEPVAGDTALIVTTSGSTGTPKGVCLSAAAIRAGARATHERLGGAGDWVLALPPHHVAGVMVLARSVVSGTICTRVGPHLTELPLPRRRTYLSLVPTQLQRALADPVLTRRLAAYAAVLLGGAAASTDLLDRARDAGLSVVTSYGMSETCGGCVYDGRPLTGVDIELVGDRRRITIGGPIAFSGYRLQPALTAASLVGGRVQTNDHGRWHAGRLEVLGRLDDVVISGGENVDLAAVERILQRRWPQTTAIGVPDPIWGHLVVAAGAGLPELSVLRETLTSLAPAARPRGVLRMDQLPLTSSGKVDRRRLIAEWPDHLDKEQL